MDCGVDAKPESSEAADKQRDSVSLIIFSDESDGVRHVSHAEAQCGRVINLLKKI